MSKHACHLSFILWGFQWNLNALQTINLSFWEKALALTALCSAARPPVGKYGSDVVWCISYGTYFPCLGMHKQNSACQVVKHWAKETPRGSEFWYVFSHCRPDSRNDQVLTCLFWEKWGSFSLDLIIEYMRNVLMAWSYFCAYECATSDLASKVNCPKW